MDYRLLVSGAHLDPNFGSTLDEIRGDGFHIDAEVKIEMDAGSLFATAQAIGSGVLANSRVLNELKPDMMVVYADRFEGFAAVIAASQMNIPTAHIEGGDLTEGGTLDDSVRHAMTKLAHLHFTTNQQASNRILAMGEESWRVHTVGFPGIDLISERRFASAIEVAEKLNLDLSRPIVLFTQHSVSTEFSQAAAQLSPSLLAIKQLATEGIQTILTYPNNDAGGQAIIEQLKIFESAQLVDLVNGMQKVKMPKKEEKKKLKENKIKTDIKGQIVQATNNDGVTFSKNDDAKAIDNGEKIKITGFKEEQGKIKALFSKGMFASAIDIDGLEKVVSASPIAQALTKEEIEELISEVTNEYFDGRDNLINPLSAEDENN